MDTPVFHFISGANTDLHELHWQLGWGGGGFTQPMTAVITPFVGPPFRVVLPATFTRRDPLEPSKALRFGDSSKGGRLKFSPADLAVEDVYILVQL